MKRNIWIGIIIVTTLAAGWTGRAAWRAHNDIVTLHVKNAPVAEVVRRLEHQTWETIIADTNFNGRVTLDLDNVPLTNALDKLATEAGGVSGIYHAVYRSDYGLRQLKASLMNGRDDCEGWTNLASRAGASGFGSFSPLPAAGSQDDINKQIAEALKNAGPGATPVVINGASDMAGLPDEVRAALKNATGGQRVAQYSSVRVPVAIKVIANGGSAGGFDSASMSKQIQDAVQQAMGSVGTNLFNGGQLTNNTRVFTLGNGTNGLDSASLPPEIRDALQKSVSGPPGGIDGGVKVSVMRAGQNGEGKDWAPERLMMQSYLLPPSGSDVTYEPTRAGAEVVAREVHARTKTFFVLEKNPQAIPGMDMSRLRNVISDAVLGTLSTNSGNMLDNLSQNVEQMARRSKADQYLKLTPEQRAENARLARQSTAANP